MYTYLILLVLATLQLASLLMFFVLSALRGFSRGILMVQNPEAARREVEMV